MHTAMIAVVIATAGVGQQPNDVFFTNHQNLQMPIQVQPNAQLRLVQLYVSTDHGKTWWLIDAITPDKDRFIFRATKEGEHWFQAVGTDSQGRRDPANLAQGAPAQKMIIDTIRPNIELTALRTGDDILAHFSIQESFPDLATLKLDWRPKTGPTTAWTAVPVDAKLSGRAQFRVNRAGPTLLRLQLRDKADNVSVRETEASGK